MPEIAMESGEKILFLFLGWLLGLLSPIIIDSIRKYREREETKRALIVELQEVMLRLTGLMFLIIQHIGKLDRELLEFMKHIIETYDGIHRMDDILETVKRLLKSKDEAIQTTSKIMAGYERKGLGFKKFVVPLLDSKIGQLRAFDHKDQNLLLEIRAYLNIFNEEVDQYRFYFNQTFNSNLSPENHKIIQDNIRHSYENLLDQARLIVNLIQGVLKTPKTSLKI